MRVGYHDCRACRIETQSDQAWARGPPSAVQHISLHSSGSPQRISMARKGATRKRFSKQRVQASKRSKQADKQAGKQAAASKRGGEQAGKQEGKHAGKQAMKPVDAVQHDAVQDDTVKDHAVQDDAVMERTVQDIGVKDHEMQDRAKVRKDATQQEAVKGKGGYTHSGWTQRAKAPEDPHAVLSAMKFHWRCMANMAWHKCPGTQEDMKYHWRRLSKLAWE